MATALIVDNSDDTLVEISRVFREKGFSTETCRTISAAREALLRRMPEVAVLNETVDGEQTLDLLMQVDVSRVVEIYLMSDKPSLETATKAMNVGVSDYFQKPIDVSRLLRNLDALESESAENLVDVHEDAKSGSGLLVGDSQPIERLKRLVRKVAPSEASVLIAGESGTGKELVARTIHALSARANRDLVAMNCSAIAPELMESELFGHVKGSFTGATRNHKGFFRRANGGTLFLDEITELDISLQAKLLRAIETQSVVPVGAEREISFDVRIVSATNRNPQEAVNDGVLREDLYFRLAQFPMRIPPLRERSSDVELLARHFLQEQIESQGIEKRFAKEVFDLFAVHHWPGNVRELRNTVIHGYLLAGEEITIDDLPEHVPNSGTQENGPVKTQVGMTLAAVERRHLLATLAHFGGDKKRTAETLGISLKTLYNRLKRYNVS